MENQPPDPLRVVALVHQLQDRFGPQEFGQIVQTLLALTFHQAGFEVLRNTVGVPDLLLSRPETREGYAIEVKTGDEKITLSQRDLDGVLSGGRTAVLAALFLSDPSLHWFTVDARRLRPTSYRRYELDSRPPIDFGFNLTEKFSRVLTKNHPVSMEGPGPLARLLASHDRKHHDLSTINPSHNSPNP
jgi:hypothetical protein